MRLARSPLPARGPSPFSPPLGRCDGGEGWPAQARRSSPGSGALPLLSSSRAARRWRGPAGAGAAGATVDAGVVVVEEGWIWSAPSLPGALPRQRNIGLRPPVRRPARRGGGTEAGMARCRREGQARLWWRRWRRPVAE